MNANRNLRRAFKRERSRQSASVKERDFEITRRITDEALKAIVAASVGYALSAFISADQLYRYMFLPNPENFVGTWAGLVDGIPSNLIIKTQGDDRPYKISGTLRVGENDNALEIAVSGDADSIVSIHGEISEKKYILLTLDRVISDERKPGEHDIRLIPPEGESGAARCKNSPEPFKDPDISNRCEKLTGRTFFFR